MITAIISGIAYKNKLTFTETVSINEKEKKIETKKKEEKVVKKTEPKKNLVF